MSLNEGKSGWKYYLWKAAVAAALPVALVVCSLAGFSAGLSGCNKAGVPQPDAPKPRIVSFSPALTSILFEMGLGDHVVGVTTQCRPPAGQQRRALGDAFKPNAEAIAAVEPDLLLIQQTPAQFDAFHQIKPNVKIEHFDIETLADIAAAMEKIGTLAGEPQLGRESSRQFTDRLDAVRKSVAGQPRPKVLFLIAYEFNKPGTGGRNSFIHEMIDAAGGSDAAEKYTRWSDLNLAAILEMQPEALVVWTQPGSEQAAKDYWLGVEGLSTPKASRFVVTDPNWTIPSPKLADLTAELAKMIHPHREVSP